MKIAANCASNERSSPIISRAAGTKVPPIKTNRKVDQQILNTIRDHAPSHLFKGAADEGIIFAPEDFASYLFGDRIEKTAVEGMKTHLPHIFEELQKEAGDVVNNEKFEPLGNDKSLNQFLSKLAYDYSLFEQHVISRIENLSIEKKASHQDVAKTNSKFDRELAKEYVAYKLAALNYLDQAGKLTDDLLMNAVIQNRQ